jgi:hypothetical protein
MRLLLGVTIKCGSSASQGYKALGACMHACVGRSFQRQRSQCVLRSGGLCWAANNTPLPQLGIEVVSLYGHHNGAH